MKAAQTLVAGGLCLAATLLLTLNSCNYGRPFSKNTGNSRSVVGQKDVAEEPNTYSKASEEKNAPPAPPVVNAITMGTVTEQGAADEAPVAGTYTVTVHDANGVTYSWKPADKEDQKAPGNTQQQEFNTEAYNYIQENEFLRPLEKPLSTFSIDVDVASYGIMRKKLESGQSVPKDAVRLEELVNYFNYNYAEPAAGQPFSVNTELSACPWNANHKLLRIGIHGKSIDTKELPSANLVFLIDVSGSMDEADKLPLVKSSLRLLVNQLGPKDRVAIVTYAGASGLALPSTACSNKEKIFKAIEDMEAGGSTNGADGIELAYKVAKENFMAEGNNRVILCTDGDFNVGVTSDGDLVRLIEKKRKEGVFLSVLGYGMGNYQDGKMEQLADKGNGNYAYIDNIFEANKNLVSQMGATLLCIAKDVKIQVEFNPVKVKGYRLLGYENRVMADQDFNDDTKDAGEIGAGTNVTAFYEITTSENDESLNKPKVDALKYQSLGNAGNSTDLLTVKLRYKEPKEEKSKLIEMPVADNSTAFASASEDFRFAASVISFGMLLRDSKFKGNSSIDKVLEWARNAKGADSEGYRTEFIRLAGLAKNTL
ncbi:MAG: VWA domain-containing protein [Chitinophagales bacterium]